MQSHILTSTNIHPPFNSTILQSAVPTKSISRGRFLIYSYSSLLWFDLRSFPCIQSGIDSGDQERKMCSWIRYTQITGEKTLETAEIWRADTSSWSRQCGACGNNLARSSRVTDRGVCCPSSSTTVSASESSTSSSHCVLVCGCCCCCWRSCCCSSTVCPCSLRKLAILVSKADRLCCSSGSPKLAEREECVRVLLCEFACVHGSSSSSDGGSLPTILHTAILMLRASPRILLM